MKTFLFYIENYSIWLIQKRYRRMTYTESYDFLFTFSKLISLFVSQISPEQKVEFIR
jgi:hypothetical protein